MARFDALVIVGRAHGRVQGLIMGGIVQNADVVRKVNAQQVEAYGCDGTWGAYAFYCFYCGMEGGVENGYLQEPHYCDCCAFVEQGDRSYLILRSDLVFMLLVHNLVLLFVHRAVMFVSLDIILVIKIIYTV